jgi:hypothetical protein
LMKFWYTSVFVNVGRLTALWNARFTSFMIKFGLDCIGDVVVFLCDFAKSKKASWCLSLRSPVYPLGKSQLSLEGFSWNLIFEHFSKTLSR